MTTRIGVFGWGIVAPKSPTIDAFAANLERADTWLTPFHGFGPDNFLVGTPEFDFAAYKPWIEQRFPPSRFHQLSVKMDPFVLFAIGAFVQALDQNPGLEQVLKDLGRAAHVYIGTGLGAYPTLYDISVDLYRAQRQWNRFWSVPERNGALAAHLDGSHPNPEAPTDPASAAESEREAAEEAWWAFWAPLSDGLSRYLDTVREIESENVEGDVETGKLRLIKHKRRRHQELQAEWGCPDPPWSRVSSNLVWNIHNTPASQVSMLGEITGLAFSPVAACSTFGVSLKLGMDAIRRGEARAVVVGATDPPPHALTVGTFFSARVISADAQVSKPLAGLRGTHVAGGSVVWIIGDLDFMLEKGFHPLGMEPIGVGVSSDADHIITPSLDGPLAAMEMALAEAAVTPDQVGTWDMHATATPGDYQEVKTLRALLGDDVLVTARKGTFGHGMGAGTGWELTAQYLAASGGSVFPTPLGREELNPEIAKLHRDFVFDQACASGAAIAGKMAMGIGGINACVVSRRWTPSSPQEREAGETD